VVLSTSSPNVSTAMQGPVGCIAGTVPSSKVAAALTNRRRDNKARNQTAQSTVLSAAQWTGS